MPDARVDASWPPQGELTQARRLARAGRADARTTPRPHRFTENFAGQWLDLRKINATSPDPQIYGEFDDFLFWSMPRETELFFEEVLRARPEPDRVRPFRLDVPESSGWPSTTASRASPAASCARSSSRRAAIAAAS